MQVPSYSTPLLAHTPASGAVGLLGRDQYRGKVPVKPAYLGPGVRFGWIITGKRERRGYCIAYSFTTLRNQAEISFNEGRVSGEHV